MKTYDELTNDIIEKAKSEKARRRRLKRRICAGMTAFALVLGGLLAAHLTNRTPSLPILDTPADSPAKVGNDNPDQTLSAKDDYGAIFDHLITRTDYSESNGIKGGYFNLSDAKPEGELGIPLAPNEPTTSPDEAEFSGTNIQVDGVMEADFVKTDGEYIYAVSHKHIYIYSAKDGQMELAVKIPYLNGDGSVITKNSDGDTKLYSYQTPELYIEDGRLILIVQAMDAVDSSDIPEESNELYKYDSLCLSSGHEYLCAMIYDISTLTSPVLLSSASISGEVLSTRMNGDRLYLVAADSYVYGPTPKKSDPSSYIPKCVINGQKYLINKESIYCGNDKADCEYLNVLEVNVSDGGVSSSLSLLGYSGDIMYQSPGSIYVARTNYRDNIENVSAESLSPTDGIKVERHTGMLMTTVTKISVSDGLSLEASAELEGYLENSFSMDEHNSYLRVVLSVNKDMYTEHKMPNGSTYCDNILNEVSNSLYVLDSSLNVVGSLTGLAPDERIYSCRFDGDDAYFVTYRETDPLFHVDLRDVTNPTVVGELKLPGFSEHLQRFGDMLFGFGQTDKGELKLSMFSENDDGSMNELSTAVVKDAYYSGALYDHHALVVDYRKNIISFGAAVDDQSNGLSRSVYYIYSYGEEGFELKAEIDLSAEFYALDINVRGFYIGDWFYVYQNNPQRSAITSYSMSEFAQIDEKAMDTTYSD